MAVRPVRAPSDFGFPSGALLPMGQTGGGGRSVRATSGVLGSCQTSCGPLVGPEPVICSPSLAPSVALSLAGVPRRHDVGAGDCLRSGLPGTPCSRRVDLNEQVNSCQPPLIFNDLARVSIPAGAWTRDNLSWRMGWGACSRSAREALALGREGRETVRHERALLCSQCAAAPCASL